eukprot:944659-Amphidinium_carterae.1
MPQQRFTPLAMGQVGRMRVRWAFFSRLWAYFAAGVPPPLDVGRWLALAEDARDIQEPLTRIAELLGP